MIVMIMVALMTPKTHKKMIVMKNAVATTMI